MFVHLHNHFLVDSSIKVEDAIKKIKKDNQPAIAITDHNLVSLHIKFYQECVRAGVKPILGCECYFVDDCGANKIENDKNKEHLLIIAKTEIGLKNLYALTNASRKNHYIKEKVSLVD